jgi:hypothetical protein
VACAAQARASDVSKRAAAIRFCRRFLEFGWGMLAHPRYTIDRLAAERSIRWGVGVVCLGVLQVWGNMLLFAIFGFDWLGSRPMLEDPTYVGGFGYLRVSADWWVPLFAAYMPMNALYALVITPGAAHLISKVWGGRGTFEQMVNLLTFANVPSLVVGWISEWLTGVPLNLVTGEPYFYDAAMEGAYGSTVAALWTGYSVAVYVVPWAWGLALGTAAIRHVQEIPWWSAAAAMVAAFALQMLVLSTFVR